MAFQQKEWKNRLSENPTRRLLTPVDGSTPFQVDVTRAEGTIMQQGDPFNAANMNDLEARIAAGIGGGDENMAPIEEGPESANPYAVGDLLIYDGQLYRVISAIAIGNSLVEGVNIEATTLADEAKDIQDELTANGNRIYFDYQNGKYGFNTSPTRGADTFNPFKNGSDIVTYTLRAGGSYTVPEDCTAKLFLFVCNDCVGWNGSWGTNATLTLKKNGTAVDSVSSSASVPERGAALGYNCKTTTLELTAGDVFTISMSTYLCNGGGYVGFAMM